MTVLPCEDSGLLGGWLFTPAFRAGLTAFATDSGFSRRSLLIVITVLGFDPPPSLDIVYLMRIRFGCDFILEVSDIGEPNALLFTAGTGAALGGSKASR